MEDFAESESYEIRSDLCSANVTLLPPQNCQHFLCARLMFSDSATLKQALHADLVLLTLTSWALDISNVCARLRDCEAVTHIHKLTCRGTLFVTQFHC